ncbi:MAG: PASTA domain-containing protein [Bacteroidales bacterium]|nr:PASTA domain-containing protein [Bacteroidales bacterium]
MESQENKRNNQGHKSKESIYRRFVNLNHDHPVLMNIVYIFIAACVLVWVLLMFIDSWTLHGEESVVPSVKGQSIELAEKTLSSDGFQCEVMDSVFGSQLAPGTVVEQTPREGSKVKPGRTVYVSIVAYSPKLVTVPDFMNVSMRQGVSMFEGLGLKVNVVTVPSEFKDLVLGAKCNGRALRAGERIPSTSSVTVEVGGGITDEIEDTETEDELTTEINIE